MNIVLERATIDDAELIRDMQVKCFEKLLNKYEDYDTNPGNESLERVKCKLSQDYTYYYLIKLDDVIVGAIRIVDKKDKTNKRIAPIYILPEYHNRGIAQRAIQEVEKIHGKENWELDTILQEKGNCYLYEKMGYKKTGKTEVINDKITLVFYEK